MIGDQVLKNRRRLYKYGTSWGDDIRLDYDPAYTQFYADPIAEAFVPSKPRTWGKNLGQLIMSVICCR